MKYYPYELQLLKTGSHTSVSDKTDFAGEIASESAGDLAKESTKKPATDPAAANKPRILLITNRHLGEVTLNHPDRLNSFILPMHKRLYRQLEALEQSEEYLAILLTGCGQAVCTGRDLNDRDSRQPDGPRDLYHEGVLAFLEKAPPSLESENI